MQVTGVITECNPFHEGHAYFLREARARTGCDYLIAAMSGSYVQRGEPAVFDKSVRTKALLEGGADLVLEIPPVCACGSAPCFAEGSVLLLSSLGLVGSLCFGSESGDGSALAETGRRLVSAEEDPAFQEELRRLLHEGRSFPAARQEALSRLGIAVPDSPNDLLAVEYCRAIEAHDLSLKPLAVRRTSAESAGSLRSRLRDGLLPPETYPACVRDQAGFDHEAPACILSPDDFSGQLLQALLSEEDLSVYMDVSKDLADRIRRLLPAYESFTSFAGLLKTRNMTYTRIMRSLLHILLGIREDDHRALRAAGYAGYARVLGFRRASSPLLTALSASSRIPLVTRMAGAGDGLSDLFRRDLDRSVRADFLYTRTSAMTAAAKGLPAGTGPRTEYERKLVIL